MRALAVLALFALLSGCVFTEPDQIFDVSVTSSAPFEAKQGADAGGQATLVLVNGTREVLTASNGVIDVSFEEPRATIQIVGYRRSIGYVAHALEEGCLVSVEDQERTKREPAEAVTGVLAIDVRWADIAFSCAPTTARLEIGFR